MGLPALSPLPTTLTFSNQPKPYWPDRPIHSMQLLVWLNPSQSNHLRMQYAFFNQLLFKSMLLSQMRSSLPSQCNALRRSIHPNIHYARKTIDRDEGKATFLCLHVKYTTSVPSQFWHGSASSAHYNSCARCQNHLRFMQYSKRRAQEFEILCQLNKANVEFTYQCTFGSN